MLSKAIRTASLALAAATLLAGVASAQTPEYVRIRNVTYAGTGCPAGTIAESISPDLQAMRLLFDDFTAEAGPGVPITQSRKNCQLMVDIEFPQGWSYALEGVEVKGYAGLDPDVAATQDMTYYFQGQSASARLRTTLRGPMSRDYVLRDRLSGAALVWSPCGARRALNVNLQARVDNARNRQARGILTVDSVEALSTYTYGLRWRRCY